MDTDQLVDMEPERKKKDKNLYLKPILMVVIGVSLFFFIVLENYNKLNQLKSQSLSMVKSTSLKYKMTSELLPVHHFTYFDKIEVTNRMECLLNKEAVPCMKYCETIT